MVDIYLDMDDVVAEWRGFAEKFFGRSITREERLPDEEWQTISRDQRMYAKLGLKTGAHELVEWCKQYARTHNGNVYFLTAIPRKNNMPYALMDKVRWAERYFPGIPCFFGPYAVDKAQHCTGSDSILIDDRISNCSAWVAAGGRAHIYRNWEDCKVWLEQELL
jgi:5'(3')-deoxyribonucleotidase